MSALRCILAATDLSAPARGAADRAARIAQRACSSLTLVHAVSGSALDELRRWPDTGALSNRRSSSMCVVACATADPGGVTSTRSASTMGCHRR